ncbi:hypothetical protein TNCV_3196321 [Trichonephila clavipes]|nr:hypothetical protein TNCV_3196321 [Trichonephila clavipes]
MRRTVAPVECPAEPWMDFLVNEVEVSSRIPTPPLITRCDKSIQTDPPTFISNPLERSPPGRKTLFCWCPTIIPSLHWSLCGECSKEMGEKGFLESVSPTFRIDSSGKDMRRTGFEGPDWREKA